MTRRMITSDMWDDDFIGEMTFLERILWIGLITLADDQGRLPNNPVVFRSRIFPYDEEITRQYIENGIIKFEKAGKVFCYEVNGKKLLQIVNWWKHQSPQWPQESRYPAPDGWTDRIRQHTQDNKVNAVNWNHPGGFSACSDVPTPVPTPVPTEVGYTIEESRVVKRGEERRGEEVEQKSFSDFSLPVPETPKQALEHPAIQVFHAITGRIPGKANYAVVIETLQLLRERARAPDDELIRMLQPYWLAWSNRQNRETGKPYRSDGIAWITEWAVNGEIPPENNGHAKSKGQQFKDQNDAVIAAFLEKSDATQ